MFRFQYSVTGFAAGASHSATAYTHVTGFRPPLPLNEPWNGPILTIRDRRSFEVAGTATPHAGPVQQIAEQYWLGCQADYGFKHSKVSIVCGRRAGWQPSVREASRRGSDFEFCASRSPELHYLNGPHSSPTIAFKISAIFPELEARLGTSLSSLISAADGGNRAAAEALFAALYSELHRLAKHELASVGLPVTISATTLLHQAYIDMAGNERVNFPDKARFMGYAARVMRGLIIDYARNRRAQKRGGQFEITSLGTNADSMPDDRELTRISEALDQLAESDAALAEVVDLRFFCGFTFNEIAAMKAISERTVQRQWEKARIYLHRTIRADLEP